MKKGKKHIDLLLVYGALTSDDYWQCSNRNIQSQHYQRVYAILIRERELAATADLLYFFFFLSFFNFNFKKYKILKYISKIR